MFEKNTERKLVQMKFDPVDEEVWIVAVGEEGDRHNTELLDGNKGFAILSYPLDFEGSSDLELKNAHGVLATTSITV